MTHTHDTHTHTSMRDRVPGEVGTAMVDVGLMNVSYTNLAVALTSSGLAVVR